MERTIPRVDASRDELLPYVGPAAALPMFGALARLPWNVAERLWSALLVLALSVLVLCALALARTHALEALAAAFALALGCGPVISDLALGQVALVSAAGVAGALVAFERRAVLPGAFAAFVAAAQPNLALVLAARLRDRAAVAGTALAAGAFLALTFALGGGPPGLAAYLQRLAEHGRAERFVDIQHTPIALAYALGASTSAAAAAGTAIGLAAVVALVAAAVRTRASARDTTLLALAALPFAVPFFHEHDFVVELLPLTILGVRAHGAARAWAGIAAVLVLTDWLGLAQRPPARPQIAVEALAVAGGFIALGGKPLMRWDWTPVATAAASLAFALPLAAAHPAPTWPDVLPAHYHAPPTADASATWADELHVCGLDVRAPAWAALRALPLAGSAALFIALALYARQRKAPPSP